MGGEWMPTERPRTYEKTFCGAAYVLADTFTLRRRDTSGGTSRLSVSEVVAGVDIHLCREVETVDVDESADELETIACITIVSAKRQNQWEKTKH